MGDYFFPAIVEKVDGVTSEIDWISSEVVGSFVYHVRVSRFVSHAYAEYIGRESEERSVYIPEDFLYRILPLAPDDGGDTESEEEDEEPEQTLRARRRTRNRSRAPLTKKGQIQRLQGHLRSNDLLPRQGQQQHYKYRDILEGEDGARGQYCDDQELNPGPQRPQGRPAVVTREGARPWSSGRLTDHSNQTTTQRHT